MICICPHVCTNKNALGYCQSTCCINPLYNFDDYTFTFCTDDGWTKVTEEDWKRNKELLTDGSFKMTLGELISVVGDDDQIIALLAGDEWCGVFPAVFLPNDYKNYKVESIMPDKFDGNSPFDGIVLKVWVTE